MNYWFLTMFSHARANCIGACHNSSHSNCISMTIQQLHNIILFKSPYDRHDSNRQQTDSLRPTQSFDCFLLKPQLSFSKPIAMCHPLFNSRNYRFRRNKTRTIDLIRSVNQISQNIIYSSICNEDNNSFIGNLPCNRAFGQHTATTES